MKKILLTFFSALFAVAAVLTKCRLHPIVVICASAVLGIAAGYLIPGVG